MIIYRAARTTSRPKARRPIRCWPSRRACASGSGPTGRSWPGRVRFLAGEAGLRQFLDIGTGIPAADNTHQVAQEVAPDARIVYVDNDPIVLAHARVLLASGPHGATQYVHGDVRDPAAILRAAAETLDFSQPIALMLLGICTWCRTARIRTGSWLS